MGKCSTQLRGFLPFEPWARSVDAGPGAGHPLVTVDVVAFNTISCCVLVRLDVLSFGRALDCMDGRIGHTAVCNENDVVIVSKVEQHH